MSEGINPSINNEPALTLQEVDNWVKENSSKIIDSGLEKEIAIEKLSAQMNRCKGTGKEVSNQDEVVRDCSEHTLDDFNQKVGAQIELDSRLANFIFNEIISKGYKIIITSGFRCPEHNHFSQVFDDSGKTKKDSLHSKAEAVDFIVLNNQGLPLTYQENKDFEKVLESQKEYIIPQDKLNKLHEQNPYISTNIKIQFFITSYKPEEGRDPDNNHDWSYMHLDFRTISTNYLLDKQQNNDAGLV
ncbi:MAG: hypothetical protein ACD_58C00276G0005 [uncultured bacterium]|nr:MAG: hypothetical protein ACD_58C00276G0005 [uncultured bacterium]